MKDYHRVIRDEISAEDQENEKEFDRIFGLFIALAMGMAIGVFGTLATVTSWSWLT